jgi:hypothetical protein
MALETEIAYFDEIKQHLLDSAEGKYALILGRHLEGTFDSAENAYSAGILKFEQEQFLVRKVTRTEQVFTNHALSHGLLNVHP